MAKAVLIVHSRPVEASREDEFNKWYDEVHIPDVTSVSGVVSGRRFKKAGGADDGGYPYLAIYELDTEDVGATMKELMDRTGTGRSSCLRRSSRREPSPGYSSPCSLAALPPQGLRAAGLALIDKGAI